MRIVSKFHDYYDIGLAYGQDPKLVWVRETREVPYVRDSTPGTPEWLRSAMRDSGLSAAEGHLAYDQWEPDGPGIPTVLLLFCGRAYLGVGFRGTWHWSLESLLAAIAASGDRRLTEGLAETGWRRRVPHLPKMKGLEKSWEPLDALNSRREFLDGLHRGAGTPVMAWFRGGERMKGWSRPVTVVLDPRLRELGFASVVDPYAAFQELSMYLGNVIGIPENPTVDISDADKAAKHGYNELSFRNPTRL